MARPKENGLEYFPFDVDFFEDEKIQAISGEFGLKGELTTIKLLCAVYRNGYFIVWSDMLKMKLLRSLPGVGAELLNQIVSRLVKWGFFDESLFNSEKILTSRGIQRRYFEAIKRRVKSEHYPYLLVSAYNNGVSAYINDSSSGISVCKNTTKESKVKESKVYPPQTPPNGSVSSDGGGRTTSSPSSEKYLDIKTGLRGKPGVTENDVWEAMRLTENGKESSVGTPLVKQWIDNPTMCNFYEVIQKLQQMEKAGQIRVMSHENYFVYVFLLLNLPKSDADAVRSYIQNPLLFEECKKLIAEIKKGGINIPGKFLLKKLRECMAGINRRNLK